MEQVNVQDAKTHLSRLLARVERGETVTIARGGHPIARLSPIDDSGPRELGFLDLDVPDSFFEPLPGAELDAWD
ncbi:type II toxin-antitoxin system Phd/YefM family antitoxin [Microbacterium sp. B2969]|uniref:Antitoxin n=1 Tax=Microbacterium alkaliflavum TaxID=3248839 RepID=A0ABW7Q9X5_9MICO